MKFSAVRIRTIKGLFFRCKLLLCCFLAHRLPFSEILQLCALLVREKRLVNKRSKETLDEFHCFELKNDPGSKKDTKKDE